MKTKSSVGIGQPGLGGAVVGLLGSLGALAGGYTLRWLHRRGILNLAP